MGAEKPIDDHNLKVLGIQVWIGTHYFKQQKSRNELNNYDFLLFSLKIVFKLLSF